MRPSTSRTRLSMLAAALLPLACETPEATPTQCPMALPQASTRCTAPDCSRTETGTKTYAQAELSSETATSWLVITALTSELSDNENLDVLYAKTNAGVRGLAPAAAGDKASREAALRARLDDEGYEALFGAARLERIRAERRVRSESVRDPVDLSRVRGTAVRGGTAAFLPEGARRQTMRCSAEAPGCGDRALCVIPSGETLGTCETALTFKWRPPGGGAAQELAASVLRVGQHGAIVVEDGTMLSAADADALLARFDQHIAPLDHALFGEPRDAGGKDRDGNGVTMFLFTPRVREWGETLVGFFASTDLQDPARVPTSNGADVLYLAPPSANVTLPQLSGTIAHEYQHLINFYAKVLNRRSSQESVWLDEGLSTFAEDVTGYGVDAFANIAAYLATQSETSLTGYGLTGESEEGDTSGRRGMAHLLVRYYFEQRGGARFLEAPGAFTDLGGVAAVRALVEAPETGSDLFARAKTGRSFGEWVLDLLTMVALDGTNYPEVSCNPRYQLAAPEPVPFTSYQRGLDLRTAIPRPEGGTIPLAGPMLATFESEQVPVPVNGGELRTLAVPAGTTSIGVATATGDYEVGLRAIPLSR